MHGYTLISDDRGDNWRVGMVDYSGGGVTGHNYCNENQAVELRYWIRLLGVELGGGVEVCD